MIRSAWQTPLKIWIGLSLVLAIFVARMVPTWTTFNDTIDEPYHLGAGLCLIQTGHLLRGYQHPPLARLVAALPVYLSGVHDDFESLSGPPDDLSAFHVGHGALQRSGINYWSVLVRGRAAMLLFPIVALIYTYRLTRWLAGRTTGLLAAAWLSFDPTLLGHSTWITTDVPAAAGMIVALYYGLRYIGRPTASRAIFCGVAGGLAVACKFTLVLAAPALLAVMILHRPRQRAVWLWLPAIAASGFVVLWATYFFELGPHGLPMPALWRGLTELRAHLDAGHGSYFNGSVGTGGWFWYFPEAILLKSTLSLLVGIALAIGGLLLAQRRHRRVLILAIPSALFLGVAMASGLNLGIRHILPALALIYPWAAVVLRRRTWLLSGLCLLSGLETAWVHPDYLSYFNLFAGGTRGGERYFLDSNLDWGQDQRRAEIWLAEHAVGRSVSLHLFGNAWLIYKADVPYKLQRALEPPHGLVLVSKDVSHGLWGSYGVDANGGRVNEPPLVPPKDAKPIATIGTSIDVYELDRIDRNDK